MVLAMQGPASWPVTFGDPKVAARTASPRPQLRTMLAEGHSGPLLVGITPPRRDATDSRISEIADVTMARLDPLKLDGLILYDIDDESDRNPEERPFPYLPTIDPVDFHAHVTRQQSRDRPTIIYRCVGKYTEDELEAWMRSTDSDRVLTVFVGPSSGSKTVHTRLPRAHELHMKFRPDLLVGGVTISERHSKSGDEHLRMLAKQDMGCSFFISQVIYDLDATKNLLSDYYYACADRRVAPRPVILTLSVCGSLKTLAFLKWLGVRVPRWLENALHRTSDPLAESYDYCVAGARDLANFCQRLRMPIGFNVESVSIRKAEIDAAMALAAELGELYEPDSLGTC
jgi:hypothetical protein